MSASQPTIAAIATAPGRGGVGVIRLSGKDLLPLKNFKTAIEITAAGIDEAKVRPTFKPR